MKGTKALVTMLERKGVDTIFGYPGGSVIPIYDEIYDFANYAFNKAHAVSYAVVAYQTAWFKCHYAREYMAALLTSVLDNSDKVAEYIAELIAELSDQKVYLDGTSKLLRFPEYRDTKKAQTLLDYMEDDSRHLLPATRKIDGIQFFIGPENGENPLSETSAIYAKYDIGKIGQGAIGIVGPTRMDYAKLSAQLSRFAKGLNRLIAETFLDDKDPKH